MQRNQQRPVPNGGPRGRPGAAGGSLGSVGSAAEMETFVLRATPSIKRYNIARFDLPKLPKLSECSQPVMMYPEPERVDDEEEKKDEEPVGYNPALRKRRRRRRKDTRQNGWVIEDKDGSNKFLGTFEGGQQSTYMLLVKNRHNDEFSVMPVEQWFRFKKPLGYRTLTLEEAEELNNEKKRAVERWLMNHKLAGEDKPDSGGNDTVSAPRMRTGAVGGGGGGGGAGGGARVKSEAEDMFNVSETARPRRVARPKATEEAGPTGEDGGDFDEKFDDDESDAEIDNDVKGVPSDSESDEFEVDPEGTGKLTETGQAMKDLLKRAQSGEMLETGNEKDGEEGDGEDEDDNFTAQDMDKIKRDLGGNIIRDRSDEAPASSGGGVSNAAGGAAAENGKAGGASEANGAGKKVSTGGADGATGVGNKRANPDQSHTDGTPTKQPKTAVSSSSSTTRLTEAGVQQELMRYGGRMRTRDLLKKLRRVIVTDNDKALLKDILRTICDVEVDAIDGRLLVLKSQFR